MKNVSAIYYLAACALVTVMLLLIYAVVQQTYRTGLNDPQVQMARDTRLKLEQGTTIEPVIGTGSFDITRSLSPFIVLYDAQGKPLRSNALLDNKMPQLPVGVFEVVRKNDEHDVSWQPRNGVRMAMVIVKTNAAPVAFVAAGRSMQEVEHRAMNMRSMVFFAWILCMGIIIITGLLVKFMKPK